ncbi:patatin-like phospholipase family protein [Streptobacillus notomytis]|uniref:patatin-like phospholipase family protein n=1 Tax=Streptobacillus notomytis TaxID=1712031 RepID=UPI0009378D77|nr:patatin-like phospholipase family protein [Streptobacillus notomytis]
MRILSLDGGGLKGIYTIMMLDKIQKDFNIEYHEYFDIIIGTSTGSIIATLLASGIQPKEILKIYNDCYKEIFNEKSNGKKALFGSLYKNHNLENVVKKYINDLDYSDLKTKLVITSVNLSDSKINIVKSYDEVIKNKNEQFSLKDAIISSAAAPGYFSPHIFKNKMYVDGSLFSNNPSLIGLAESFNLGVNSLKEVKILSLGTGKEKLKFNKADISNANIRKMFKINSFLDNMIMKFLKIDEKDSGLISMAFPLIKTTMKTSVENTEYILSKILEEKNYVRINDVSRDLKIDEIPTELIGKIDEYYINHHHYDKLKIFFEEELSEFEIIKKKSWFKRQMYILSEKIREFSMN